MSASSGTVVNAMDRIEELATANNRGADQMAAQSGDVSMAVESIAAVSQAPGRVARRVPVLRARGRRAWTPGAGRGDASKPGRLAVEVQEEPTGSPIDNAIRWAKGRQTPKGRPRTGETPQ
jgi:hypothetical protein